MIGRIAGVALSAGLLMAVPPFTSASANGAAFFNKGQISENNTLYFGIIKDPKGQPVVGATVLISINGKNIDYVYETTTLGRYRSIDLPKDVDPKQVQVVVEKPGFRLANQDNRSRTVKPGLPVEINFVLAPITG